MAIDLKTFLRNCSSVMLVHPAKTAICSEKSIFDRYETPHHVGWNGYNFPLFDVSNINHDASFIDFNVRRVRIVNHVLPLSFGAAEGLLPAPFTRAGEMKERAVLLDYIHGLVSIFRHEWHCCDEGVYSAFVEIIKRCSW